MPEASSNFPYRLGVCDLAWVMFFSTWYPPTFSPHKYPQHNTDQQPQGEITRKS